MDYSEHLLREHSRATINDIAKAIGSDPAEFKKIIDIIYTAKAPLPQRASWLLAVISRSHPGLIKPYVTQFVNSVSAFKTDGIKRNMLSALCTQEIPKRSQGKIVTTCFDFILSPSETVAVKVLSLEILSQLIKDHPGLKNELKAAIEDQLPKTTVAFQSKGTKVLKKLVSL
jgi:hypothetical protein